MPVSEILKVHELSRKQPFVRSIVTLAMVGGVVFLATVPTAGTAAARAVSSPSYGRVCTPHCHACPQAPWQDCCWYTCRTTPVAAPIAAERKKLQQHQGGISAPPKVPPTKARH
jgi:hypothetical protein